MGNQCEGQFTNIIYEEYHILSQNIAIFINEQKYYDWQKRSKQLFSVGFLFNNVKFCILGKYCFNCNNNKKQLSWLS